MFKPYSKKELKEMFEEKCDECKKYFNKKTMHEIKIIDLFNWLEMKTKAEDINPYYLHDFYLCQKCYKKYFKEENEK